MLLKVAPIALLAVIILIFVAAPSTAGELWNSISGIFSGINFDDTSKPSVTIVNPPNGQNIGASGTIQVSGISFDNVGVTKVEVSTNVNAYRPATQVAAGSWDYWSFTGTIPKIGVSQVTAKATDAMGNSATYVIAVYQYGTPPTGIDTTPPNTVFTGAFDGASKPMANTGSTTSTSITISWVGNDNVAVARYEGSLGSAAFATVSTQITINNVAVGTHTYRVRAIDSSNNIDQTPMSFTWTVTSPSSTPPPPPPVQTTWIPWTVSTYRVTVSQSGSTISAIESGTNRLILSSTNAADVINAGLAAIKARNGGTLHINPGVYLITKTITLTDINNLIFEGNTKETTILRCATTGLGMLVKTGGSSHLTTNLTISNIDIDGANISSKLLNFVNIKNLLIDSVILERHNEGGSYQVEKGPGVYIEDLDGGLVQKSIMRNPNGIGDAFAIGGYRLTFQNNELYRQGTPGGGFTSGGLADSKILNNNFHDFKGYSATSLENFRIRASAGAIQHSFKNIEIAYNTYKNLDGQAISSVGHSGSGGTFYNINIHHNRIENAVGGIRLNALDSVTNVVTYSSRISDNTLLYTGGISAGPIQASEIDNNIIDRTSVNGWRGYGIYLFKVSNGITMDGNKITNTARPAYHCAGSLNITVNLNPCN